MGYKLAISKKGYDVLTETDAKNFIFDSTLNHLKTAAGGNFQQTGSDTVTVAHGLGYRPLVVAYFFDTSDTTKYYIALSGAPSVSPARESAPANVSVYVDTTYVYFKVSSTITIEVQYEIFYEGDA